jgi:hypothetical protein
MLALLLLVLTAGAVPTAALEIANEAAQMAANCPCCRGHKCMCSARMHRLMMMQQRNLPSFSGPLCRCAQDIPAVASVIAFAASVLSLTSPVGITAGSLRQTEDIYKDYVQTQGHSRAPPLA